jgi:TatA/E family protein of Tat protein translocase
MHLGMWEIVGILLVVLLLFGPSKLPQLGSSLGSAIRNFKKGFAEGTEGTPTAPAQGAPGQIASNTQTKDVGAASTQSAAPKNG